MSILKNRNLVEKRLIHLKRRFQKDLRFHEDYNKFMEEINSKGYEREAETNPPNVRTWYYHIMVFITHASPAN